MKGNKRKGRRPGTWELRVDAGRGPVDAKRQQKSVTFDGTSREADVALAELITKSTRGQVSVGQRTVADAIAAGLRQAELEGLEPTTLRGYRTSADCHVLPALALEWLLDRRDRYAKACALCGIEFGADAFVLAPEPGGGAHRQVRSRRDQPPGMQLVSAQVYSSSTDAR